MYMGPKFMILKDSLYYKLKSRKKLSKSIKIKIKLLKKLFNKIQKRDGQISNKQSHAHSNQ